ncbi:MAG: C1 family peptidase [Tannerella sp.]|jgi:bleomycin hydrolase|nr:C1 family peptidase [Tannerella sp.]
MKKNIFILCAGLLMAFQISGQDRNGGISPEMLRQIKQSYKGTPTDRAIQNAITHNDIDKLAMNYQNRNHFDACFSHKVNSRGITNQKSSGRCWLFTGLNVFRSQIIARHNLKDFQFSHSYPFFWDQLEKSNLFLQGIIDTREKPADDKMVEWLFKNPLSDGGQFTGVADIITRYGVVPADVMVETFSSDNTRQMTNLLKLKLKEFGLSLREAAAGGTTAAGLQKQKTDMLAVIYRMLVLTLGEPPAEFTWTLKDARGNPVSTKEYTPLSFYREFIGADLKNDYVMIMNDPTREYGQLYEIDFDRHAYDGENWTYVNLPVEEIKKIAIHSIKDSTMMYFSCDVGKFFDRERGLLDVNHYDYESLMGTSFGMDKKQRIRTFSSSSSHAMTLMAVDLDENGKPKKWMVENSWGPGANDGHLIMTDEWFNEYMFRLVVEKQYITDEVKAVLKQKPVRLPAWDPMFAEEE